MRLNTLKTTHSRQSAKRVGRGIGSGLGKTCGRGHKGQKSRSGGFSKIGFEGGQMPLQMRLPKRGFNSYKSRVTAEIGLAELDKLPSGMVDLAILKKASLLASKIKYVKLIKSGKVTKAFQLKGIKVTKGALAEIEAAGGTVVVGDNG